MKKGEELNSNRDSVVILNMDSNILAFFIVSFVGFYTRKDRTNNRFILGLVDSYIQGLKPEL